MSLYAACDLHSNNTVLAVLDDDGRTLFKRRCANDLATLCDALAPFANALSGVAVESTYNGYWLIDGLQNAGHRVLLVNTAAVPQYAGLKHGDDDSDARHLANLMRLGILPTCHIYPAAQRPTRDLMRRRMLLVQQSVRLLQSVQGHWARASGQRLSANAFRKLSAAELQARFIDPTERFTVLNLIQAWQNLQRTIARMEDLVDSEVKRLPQIAALRSIPGIGPILSQTIALETGEIERFHSAGEYASYCRMVPAIRLSNGKKKGTGNRKCGNRYLAWAWMEAANFAIRHEAPIRAWYQRNAARKHRLVALKAVGHKLARSGYHLMRNGGRFEVARTFG